MNDAQTPDLRAAARELDDAGLCVLPIKADGSKAAAVRSWTPYKVQRSVPAEHDHWFGGDRTRGIAVIYGTVSGNSELLEIEGHAMRDGILDQVTEIMQASGLGDVWDAILNGWVTESPSGGRHYRVRIDGGPVPPNTKLASRLAREDEYTDAERQRLAEKPNTKVVRVLIETRGEGGYGLVEPSCGPVHPSGRPYVRIAGGPDNIPVIDADVMDAVREVCRIADQMPTPEAPKTAPRPAPPLPGGGLRPGEDYNQRADWVDILTGIFRPLITRGHTTYWGWADGTRGVKATTGRDPEADRLWVFTTSSEFQDSVPYSKFGAYAHLHHGGDFKAAAAQLRRDGFGTEPPRRRLNLVPPQPGPFSDGSSALDPDHAPDAQEESDTGPGLRIVNSKPGLDITNEADAIDGLLGIMASGQLPDLYKRSSGPCWVYQDDEGNPLIRQLGADNLRAYLAEHVTTYSVVSDPLTEGTKEVRELVMPKTCSTVLGRRDWPLMPLRGIVTAPVVRPDGTLITAPGYDKPTGLYMHPRVPLRRLAPAISDESLQRAKHIVLEQMLADFPFVDDSDRAQYLGALLSPIIRPYMPGPTPLVVITGTSQASGKTLLKDVFGRLYGLAETPWAENDAELRKAITAKMWDCGDPIIAMDNLPNGHIIKSPILSSLVTSASWSDRLLGSTSSVTIPNDRLWVLTGNNLRTGGDNGRRTLWVRLDPDCPNPDQRDNFTIGDLRTWLAENASTVVAALVTMVRGWLAAGARTINTRMGDYSQWASVIAGILDYLQVPGWLANRGEASAALDDEAQEWAAFLTDWHQKIGTEPVTTKALLSLKDTVPQLHNGDMPSGKQLGHWLKARQGRYFEDLKVVLVYDSHLKQNTWRVEQHVDKGTGRAER